jgi:hypothetical protein
VDRGEAKAHGAEVSCRLSAGSEWPVGCGQLLSRENGSLVRRPDVRQDSRENQNNFAGAVQETDAVGPYYQWGVPRLFDISVDGYQLLARLARSDELCWV